MTTRLLFYFFLAQLILFIPLWIFLRRRKLRKVKTNRFAIPPFFKAAFIMGTSFALLVGLDHVLINPLLMSKPFDKKSWIEQPKKCYRMVNELIESGILKNKTKTEVIALFGDSFQEDRNRIGYLAHNPDELGLIDHQELSVYFYQNEQVKTVVYEWW